MGMFENEDMEEFEFFWQKESPFSQWHDSPFWKDDWNFVTAEQYMMLSKAVLFRDYEIAEKILRVKDPQQQKKLGRQVKHFSEERWNLHCIHVVKAANREKFSQNDHLRNLLFLTYPRTLVEASPYDTIWGIGWRIENDEAWDKKKWRGLNLLGFALTDVRNEMMIKEGRISDSAPVRQAEESIQPAINDMYFHTPHETEV
ncbi:hypothetical protein CHS0354_011643 [Potamilus streckersoni]|uniref:NADAR domain-containing protein n=1 Tax=Potamilus streckersoni TaxID=2493646 RepID=A0AAE0WFF3_9BIVA|nr:hypothetical protein CHS0354_011643 [Potamilus streckersoni]